jgi:hypothetical protein
MAALRDYCASLSYLTLTTFARPRRSIDFIGNNVFALQAQGTLANTNAQVVQATGNDHGEI